MIQDRKLSDNFWLHEFLESETAEKLGKEYVDRQFNPDEQVQECLTYHANKTLQPARSFLLAGIIIISGWRHMLLNNNPAIGSNERSQHPKGRSN